LGDIGWCVPTDGRRISSQCRDVFCPNWADFRITDLWARRADKPLVNSPNAPRHLVDALLSSDMKPDGARWVSYEMPGDWPGKRLVRMPRTANKKLNAINDGPRIARYLRFSLQCRVAVPPKFTVPLAEGFRCEASRRFLRRFGSDHVSFALFGHQKDRPEDITDEHQHAFYLPTRSLGDHNSLEQSGFITELHVWCPYGFTQSETQVLLSIQRLDWKDGRYPIRPVLTSMSLQPPASVPLATGAVKSRIWRSETPFVPPRHFYRDNSKRMRAAESPEKQLIGCLGQWKINLSGQVHRLGRSGEKQTILESIPPTPLWEIVRAPEGEEIPWTSAVMSPTHINGGSMKSQLNRQRIGFFMEIAFEKEVALPVPAFGHSNHFGLGLFLPVSG
jgi:CRISPR-associated protein Csb2